MAIGVNTAAVESARDILIQREMTADLVSTWLVIWASVLVGAAAWKYLTFDRGD